MALGRARAGKAGLSERQSDCGSSSVSTSGSAISCMNGAVTPASSRCYHHALIRFQSGQHKALGAGLPARLA